MDSTAISSLDGRATVDALARTRAAAIAAEIEQVQLVAHWADISSGDATQPAGEVLAGLERSVRPGADGTPAVREFAAVELGVVLGTTTHAAQALMRDVLDLRHRHPDLWRVVLSGQARFWQARQVARATHAAGLDRDRARWVDARTTPHLGRVSWGRMLGLVEAAVVAADPDTAEERRLAAQLDRFVRTGQCNDYGVATVYARADAGDAIFFLAMCDRVAQVLELEGDHDSVEVRRSRAIGILATPARALAMLQRAEQVARAEGAVKDDLDDGPEPDRPSNEPGDHAPSVVALDPTLPPETFAPPATLYVHLSLEQFLGSGHGSGTAEGVGAVTRQAAVELLGHTRVRLTPVVDLHQHWTVDRYRPPPRMAEHVRLATPVEIFPFGTLGCRRADLDHVVPYDPGGPPGQTGTLHLAPLSRMHHRVKTHGRGWVHRQPVPGVHYWRTPHGHWSRVDHRGTHVLGRYLDLVDRILLDDVDGAGLAERQAAALVITGERPQPTPPPVVSWTGATRRASSSRP